MISSFSKYFSRTSPAAFSSLNRSFAQSHLPSLVSYPKRNFDLHEYQSKFIMRQHGVNVQKGSLAKTPEEARDIAAGLSNKGGLILKA